MKSVALKKKTSQPQRNSANSRVETMATAVVPMPSERVGQVTFFISEETSPKNSRVEATHCFGFATSLLSLLSSAIKNPETVLGCGFHSGELPMKFGRRSEEHTS